MKAYPFNKCRYVTLAYVSLLIGMTWTMVLTGKASEPAPGKSRLFVNTHPPNAQVRIANIQGAYRHGMELDPGIYTIEVTLDGYDTTQKQVQLKAGEDVYVTFRLVKYTAPAPAKKRIQHKVQKGKLSCLPVISQDAHHTIQLLKSDRPEDKNRGAHKAYNAYLDNPVVLEAVNQELVKGYRKPQLNPVDIETLILMCQVLGASGDSRFRFTLKRILLESDNDQLKSAASENLAKLP